MSLVLIGCNGEPQTAETYVASECLLVQAFSMEESSQVVQIFKDFGRDEGFILNDSHPVNPRLISKDESFEISLRPGMGEFGANLSLWEFCETDISARDKLSLLRGRIDEFFEIVPCSNYEGYRMPMMIGYIPGCYIQQDAQSDAG